MQILLLLFDTRKLILLVCYFFQFHKLFTDFVFLLFLRQNPKDIHTLAQLISAYSLVDPEKAKAYPFDLLIVLLDSSQVAC